MIARERPAHRPATVELLEADGRWSPMAHCNRLDDSFQDLPSLRDARTVRRLDDPRVSPVGYIHLGAYTGERFAVCTYASPLRPALAAYDFQSGATLWLSPQEDLPGWPGRVPAGVLIARMRTAGAVTRRYVFAANPAEFLAYTADGTRVWKRASDEITSAAPDGVGIPVSVSYDDSRELVFATSEGWIIKLNPVDGRTIDAYRMTTTVAVAGRVYAGVLVTIKSPVIVGDVMYLLAEFRAEGARSLPPALSPVFVVRINLTQPDVPGREHVIRPLSQPLGRGRIFPDRAFVGVARGRGSPPAMVLADGRVLICAHAHRLIRGRLWTTMSGVLDDAGVMRRIWTSTLHTTSDDTVRSAPGLHAPSGTLFVATTRRMFVFHRVTALRGVVRSPEPLAFDEMVAFAGSPRVASVTLASPVGLTFDRDSGEIVVYTNFRAQATHGGGPYGFLGAFAVAVARERTRPRPLWSQPLGLSATGALVPGPGTVGQPALFRYDNGQRHKTGIIVNTVYTGTYIIT